MVLGDACNYVGMFPYPLVPDHLHAHLHLPDQCFLIGPLDKFCCFPGEACVKECKKCFSGTTCIAEQIVYNSSLNNKLRDYLTPDKN